MKSTFKLFVNPEGKIPKQASIDIADVLKTYTKKNVRITIEKWSNLRSNSQNAWYFGVAVKLITARLKESNPVKYAEITEESVHEWIKAKFLDTRMVEIAGEQKEISGTTTELTTTNFSGFMEDIQQWAAESLDLVIPDPVNETERVEQ